MKQRLYRSRINKKLGGVCAGLADYFDIDVTIVRVILCCAIFLHGIGFIAYIILWIVMPEATTQFASTNAATQQSDYSYYSSEQDVRSRRSSGIIAGMALILFGIFLLLNNLLPEFNFEDYYPILLILGGMLILAHGYMNSKNSAEVSSATTASTSPTSFSAYSTDSSPSQTEEQQ